VSDLEDGLYDRCVAGAPAQVTRQHVANLRFGRIGKPLKKIHTGHENAGRTKAALQCVVFLECLLQDTERAVLVAQALDSAQVATIHLASQAQAGSRGDPIYLYRTRAAYAMLATHVGACGPQFVPDEIGQQHATFSVTAAGDSVDRNLDGMSGILFRHD